jgi:hypothetical protein
MLSLSSLQIPLFLHVWTDFYLNMTIFRDVRPWSPINFTDVSEECTSSTFRVDELTKQPASLKLCLPLMCCLAYSAILKMEAVRSSETSVNFYRATRVISLKIVPFRDTGMRTSNPTDFYLLVYLLYYDFIKKGGGGSDKMHRCNSRNEALAWIINESQYNWLTTRYSTWNINSITQLLFPMVQILRQFSSINISFIYFL